MNAKSDNTQIGAAIDERPFAAEQQIVAVGSAVGIKTADLPVENDVRRSHSVADLFLELRQIFAGVSFWIPVHTDVRLQRRQLAALALGGRRGGEVRRLRAVSVLK